MRVRRRFDDGSDWGEGFITAVSPTLKITISSTDPGAYGCAWREVRLLPPATPEPEPEPEPEAEAEPNVM